jgi:NAD(P)-dependent dehydrogenase (short-subunit alcohol dehydrogenase family)
MSDNKQTPQPPQKQDRQPGIEAEMTPQPKDRMENWKPANKLQGKRAVVTGADSGIGRAVAIGFAKEGADVVVLYKDEHGDAEETKRHVEAAGRKCLAIAGDVGDPGFCAQAVEQAAQFLGGRIDILVNNAAEQHTCEDFAEIPEAQVERTFRTNILGYFWMAKNAVKRMGEGGAIINTTSVTAYRGSSHLLDYSATKGAIVAFTRSLSEALVEQGIRVNGVAPGPIWTPLIPATFPAKHVSEFGSDVPMKRPGEPAEVAPCFVFLACDDSSYVTGQVLHPNGGEIING